MGKFETFVNGLFSVFCIGFIIFALLTVLGSFLYYSERSSMEGIDIDKEYFFTTKVVDSHKILIVSDRYNSKNFEAIDLGKVEAEAK